MLDGCHEEPSGGAGDGAFEVFGEAAVAVEPREGAFDDPAPRDELKAHGLLRAFNNFESPVAVALQCRTQLFTSVAPVGEDVAQPREGGSDGFENQRRTVTVLDISPVNDPAYQKPVGVSDDMALASFDLFTRVKPTNTPTFGGFDALTVDHTRRGRGLFSARLAHLHQQIMVQRLPQATVSPRVKIMLDRRHWRERATRQHPPRQASTQHVKQAIHDLTIRPFCRTTQP